MRPSITKLSQRMSQAVFFTPAWSVYSRYWMRPSTRICLPLRRYFSAISACLPQTTTLCHSVLLCFSPAALRQVSVVARLKRHTGWPEVVIFSSGSFPRFPMSITLFSDPDMSSPPAGSRRSIPDSQTI